MTDVNVTRMPAPALPRTVAELKAQRKTKPKRTLNDDVEEAYFELYETPNFQRFLLPIWREETVEGSFIADDMCAAIMIRDFAKEHTLPIASKANLQSIVRSLHLVSRAHGESRKERQSRVSGVTVPDGSDDE